MLVRTVRSDLTESIERVSAAAVDANGKLLIGAGEPERPIFYRSAVKPLQAMVSQESGADLCPEHLAVACSSHSGHPAQIAIVRRILLDGGLGEHDLGTPPSWPLADTATARLQSGGHRRPRPIFHNCSGKHAAFLRACVASGWPTETYLSPDHPLQQLVIDEVREMTGVEPTPVGVDGCGAPTLRGSCVGLARAFASMSVQERYEPVATATQRFPGLVGGNERNDSKLTAWWGGPVKAGAQGLIGAGRHGIGFAAKSDSGSPIVAVMGIIEVMRRLGMLAPAAIEALDDVISPEVFGGNRVVGRMVLEPEP